MKLYILADRLKKSVEEVLKAAKKLELEEESISTQIIPRDRYANFFNTLGLIAS